MKLGILINQNARFCRLNPTIIPHLQKKYSAFASVKISHRLEEIDTLLQEFQEEGVDVLALLGGDGTLTHVLSRLEALSWKTPALLMLAGGTVNVVATYLQTHQNPFKVLDRFFRQESSFKPLLLPTLRIGDQIGFQYADGIASSFLKLFYQNKGSQKDALKLILKLSSSWLLQKSGRRLSPQDPYPQLFTPVNVKYTYKKDDLEKDWTQPTLMTWISTIPTIAYGLKAFDTPCKKEFHIGFCTMKIEQLLMMMIQMFAGKKAKHPGLYKEMSAKVLIHSQDSFLWTLDGELIEKSSHDLIIEMGTSFTFLTDRKKR